MKKIFVLLISAFASFVCVSAQNPVVSVGQGPAEAQLLCVRQEANSTLLYMRLTYTGDSYRLINVSRQMHASVDDMDYKLLNARGIPVYDESVLEYLLLESPRQKCNVILEFEKFPIDRPFDIVDDESVETALNFKSVSVDVNSTRNMDDVRFLASTPSVICGRYFESGSCYDYYLRDNVFVSLHSSYSDDHFTFYLTVRNDSDHGILFNTSKISTVGRKKRGNGTVDVMLPYVSKNSYVADVELQDYNSARSEVASKAANSLETSLSFLAIGTPYRSIERAGLNVVRGVISDVENERMKPYLKELQATRTERTGNYLQSESVPAGESLNGLFRVERLKKVDNFEISIPMDGYEFVFEGHIRR